MHAADHTEEASHKNTSPVWTCSIYNIWIFASTRLAGPITRHMGSGAPCLCVNIDRKWACGSRTCNFDAAFSSTSWVFAAVAKGTGVRVFPGVVQFDFPIGTTLNQSCVREPSGAQAAIGCPGELIQSSDCGQKNDQQNNIKLIKYAFYCWLFWPISGVLICFIMLSCWGEKFLI